MVTLIYFLISLLGSIALYPSPEHRFFGYSFLNSFISELGVTVTSRGLRNLAGSTIFNISLAFSMLALLPYWFIRKDGIAGHSWLRGLIFTCLCCFSVGLFTGAVIPYNWGPRVHTAAVSYALYAAIFALLLTTLFTNKKYYSKFYKLSWLMLIILALLAEIVLVRSVSGHILPSRPTYPLLQKFNVLIFIIWLVGDIKMFSGCVLEE